MQRALLLLTLGTLALLAGCRQEGVAQVPLPTITGPVTLRVVYAVNPRLPAFSAEQRRQLLAAAQTTVQQHFGATVRFDDRGTITIEQLFALLSRGEIARARRQIYDFKHGGGDRAQLVQAMETSLRANPAPLADLVAFARPHLSGPLATASYPALAAALTDTLLARLQQWRQLRAADGRPVLDDSDYNEWALWDALGYSELPYDIVLTNQLIASAEYLNQDVHTAVRGGITVGTTSYSRFARLGTFVFFTTFPFDNEQPALVALRGGERYGAAEAAQLAGQYLSHELGHLLFHYGHPYGRPACAMHPAELLQFRAWAAALAPSACRPDCCPAMRPGAVDIEYQAK